MKKQSTTNHEADFARMGEEMDPGKILWDDPEGITIEHDFWLSDLSHTSLKFSIWAKKKIIDKNF